MPPDYSSMWHKLDRAESLLNCLDVEIGAWHDTGPYKFITNPNEDHTCYITVVEIDPEPRIVRWSLMYADFIHNLRCVLDHMVWAIAVHKDPSLATSDETVLAYPIWDSPPNSNDRRRISLLKGSPAYDAINFMQPHNRPSTPYHPYHPLSILRDLDNTNKHKLLHLAMPGITDGTVRIVPYPQLAPGENKPMYRFHSGQIKSGIEVLRVCFDRPHPNEHIDFDFGLVITIIHKKSNAAGDDRDDFKALGAILIEEVVGVIGAVTAAVT